MRGQSSAEMLILVGAILVAVASLLYSGAGSNETAVVMSAVRAGAENEIAALDIEYGCAIDIEQLDFDAGTITIYVTVRGGPPPDDNAIKDNIRNGALKFIHNAITGSFPETAGSVKTGYYTYDVPLGNIVVTRVSK